MLLLPLLLLLLLQVGREEVRLLLLRLLLLVDVGVVGMRLLVGVASQSWSDQSHGSSGVVGVNAGVHVVVLDVPWGRWGRRGWMVRGAAWS